MSTANKEFFTVDLHIFIIIVEWSTGRYWYDGQTSTNTGAVTVGLLDAAGGGGTLASGLGGELLAGSLASGGLAGGLLGTGHFGCCFGSNERVVSP